MSLFEVKKQSIPKSLSDRFIVPPFSVFNTHAPYWCERMNYWRDLGLCGTNGRVERLSYDNRRMDKYRAKRGKKVNEYQNGTSIFSPVLTEIIYKWFTLPNSLIFDPFAGGITRGAIAAMLGHSYLGTDVSYNQVKNNYEKWLDLKFKWDIKGDAIWNNYSCLCLKDYKDFNPDLIFTCPPYYNLEIYTDLANDFSNLPTYYDFLKSYAECIEMCYKMLKDDSFMVWVVSDVRDKKTTEYYGLVADTIKIGQAAGFKFYNEIILYNDTGNLAITSGDYLNRARKVGRQHQNVLVFFKGNIKNIKSKFGEVI